MKGQTQLPKWTRKVRKQQWQNTFVFFLICVLGHLINLLVFLAPSSAVDSHERSVVMLENVLFIIIPSLSELLFWICYEASNKTTPKSNKDLTQQNLSMFDATGSQPFASSSMVKLLLVLEWCSKEVVSISKSPFCAILWKAKKIWRVQCLVLTTLFWKTCITYQETSPEGGMATCV